MQARRSVSFSGCRSAQGMDLHGRRPPVGLNREGRLRKPVADVRLPAGFAVGADYASLSKTSGSRRALPWGRITRACRRRQAPGGLHRGGRLREPVADVARVQAREQIKKPGDWSFAQSGRPNCACGSADRRTARTTPGLHFVLLPTPNRWPVALCAVINKKAWRLVLCATPKTA